MPEISSDYQEVKPEELFEVVTRLGSAWMDERLPSLQYQRCVRPELEAWENGLEVAPFAALVRCVLRLPLELRDGSASLLEVGASSGYNHRVLQVAKLPFVYTALDFSPAFRDLAMRLWPGMRFDIGDARTLPYWAGKFDIVLSGSVLLHVLEYEQVIAETARVASLYAIFHRTPVWEKPTTVYTKSAYGVPCIEVHFNQGELLRLLERYGLPVMATVDVAPASDEGLTIRSFVCQKGLFHHSV